MSYASKTNLHFDTIIIGGGQAGLAAGYYLQQQDRKFIILDGCASIGDVWRQRWESLELFTPAEYNSLPGMPFPAPADHLPTKDEVATYLQAYAQRFELPIHLQTWVEELTRHGRLYHLQTNQGSYTAQQVIVATGAYQKQRVPDFANDLEPTICQISSDQYRHPAQLPSGDVLVVGAGNSGAQIALDVATSGRRVWLSGRDTGHMKRTILGKDIFWWLSHTLFKVRVDSWLGQRLKEKMLGQGAPLLAIDEAELSEAGITRVERITAVQDGLPQTADGQILNTAAIIWATGFTTDFSWIKLPVFAPDGSPIHQRGVVETEPGLYFLGLPFLYRGNSSLIGGVGADARYIVHQITNCNRIAPASNIHKDTLPWK